MFRAALLIFFVGACAPAYTTKRTRTPPITQRVVPSPTPVAVPVVPHDIAVPRPDLGIPAIASFEPPDPTEYLRWPLTANSHPALEPAYAIAPVFASDMGWMDLCRLGAQNRRVSGARLDQLEYLRAWCDVGRLEPERAVVRLAPLLRSMVLGMPAAARLDIANILVDAGGADQAQRILAKAKIDDLAVYDTLAAAFHEIGKVRDASTFNETAINGYDFKRPGDHCQRLTRRVLLADARDRGPLLTELAPYGFDRVCATLIVELDCWHGVSCAAYLVNHGVDPRDARIGDLYLQWPLGPAGAIRWWDLAIKGLTHIDARGADVLVTSALEAAALSSGCTGDLMREARLRAFDIKMSTTHDTKLDPRLDVLSDAPMVLCTAKK